MKTKLDQKRIHDDIQKYHLEHIFPQPDKLPLQLRTYERGEIILREGADLDGIYFQVEGRTRVSSSVETGKSLLLRFCHPLSVFGEIELIQKVVIQSQVEAVQRTTFLFINKHTVDTVLMQEQGFLHKLLRQLSYKLQTCTTASRVNLLASVEERFASYLLTTRQLNEFGKEILTPHISEIASLIGTTPRHLNRVIHKLMEMNVVIKEKRQLVISDWDQLEEISGGIRYE